MMAPNIIYCAPIPFNIVFHNANKGKMRINVLDLSRFCCALGRERASRDQAASSFSDLVLSLFRCTPLLPHPFPPLNAPLRELRHQREKPPLEYSFLSHALNVFFFRNLCAPPSSSSSLSAFLFHSSFVRFAWKGLSTSLLPCKNDARCFVARTLARASFARWANIKGIYSVNCTSSALWDPLPYAEEGL